jgi:hypothetical protein
MGHHPRKEDAMTYLLLIHQGTTPLPGTQEWDALSDQENGAVYADYKAINETPGVTPGVQMAPPETATTVRVQDGKTLTTDGPFVLGRTADACDAYRRALTLVHDDAERRLLERKLAELGPAT